MIPGLKPSDTASVHRYCISTSKHNIKGCLLSTWFSCMACLERGGFQQFERMGGQKENFAFRSRLMTASAGSLLEPCHTFGEPTCTTASTGRKSTPRSRLAVQTTALSLPSCNASSTHNRKGWSIPHGAAPSHRPAQAQPTADAGTMFHLMPRVLININVLRCFSNTGNTRCDNFNPR